MLRYTKMVKLCEVEYAKKYVKLSKGMLRYVKDGGIKLCKNL